MTRDLPQRRRPRRLGAVAGMLALLCQLLGFILGTPGQALPLDAAQYAGGVPICHVHEDSGTGTPAPDHKASPGCLACPICQAGLHGAAPLPPPAPELAPPEFVRISGALPPPARPRPGAILEAAFARGPPSITSAA